MTYIVKSPRVGTPGDTWVPDAGVNIAALLAGGFIVEADKTPAKSDTTTSKKKAPDASKKREE